ncbi:MAG: hypothetical protein WC150_03235 [Bacteroidia bacterium]
MSTRNFITLIFFILLFQQCTFVRIVKRKDFNLHTCWKQSKIPINTKGVYYYVDTLFNYSEKSPEKQYYYSVGWVKFFKDGTFDTGGALLDRKVIDREIVEDLIKGIEQNNYGIWASDFCGVYHVYADNSVRTQVFVTLPFIVNTGILSTRGYFKNDSVYVETETSKNWGKRDIISRSRTEYIFMPLNMQPDSSSFWFKKKRWYRKKLNTCNP